MHPADWSSWLAGFERDEQYCPGLADAIATLRNLQPADRLVPLAQVLAERLEGCQCPTVCAELAWARVALMAETWTAAGYLPLSFSGGKSAVPLTLTRSATADDLTRKLVPLKAARCGCSGRSDRGPGAKTGAAAALRVSSARG